MTQTNDPKPPFVLALDVGTSSTRALLYDSTGAAIPNILSQQTYKLTTSGEGEVSVDADALVSVVAATIKDALNEAGDMAQQIGAVALDTFWHSLLGIDKAGKPIAPVITWEDTRSYDAAIELRKELDEKAVHDRTGVRFHASFWPAKLRWLAKNHADIFAQAAQWISFGEYLHRKFLGRSVCSLSMASATGMLTTRVGQWDSELMGVLNIRPEQLAPLGDAHDSIKGLTGEYASAWPALRDVPWFPAIGDGAAACIGSGCVSRENWSLTMGTSSAVRVVVAPEEVVPPLGLWQYLIDAKRAVVGGALSEGGNLLNWLCDTLKLPTVKEAVSLVASVEPDSHGLTILPFISGERSLGWHADARMTVSGLSIHTAPPEILRAGMESLAYQLSAVHDQLCTVLKTDARSHKMLASGGALLSSPDLRGIIADTLDTAIYPSREHEASARGAALLVLEALGVIPDLAKVPSALLEPTQPNPERTPIYRKAAERQRKLYELLLPE